VYDTNREPYIGNPILHIPPSEEIFSNQHNVDDYPTSNYSCSFSPRKDQKRQDYPSKSNYRDVQDKENQDKFRNKHRKEFSRKKEKYQETFSKTSQLPKKDFFSHEKCI